MNFKPAIGAALALAFSIAQAQGPLPAKPLRILVGYPAGQTVDIVARNFAAALGKEIGQPVFVDNRPGANGSLGAQEVKKSAPDGSTILLGTLGQMAINPTLYKKLPYDSLKDFAPVTQVSTGALLLVATPSFPANNLPELIAYAKARPGKVDFASGGNGITAHLAMVVLEKQAGLQLNHIPYKGSPAALNDVMGGQVPIMFDAMASTLPQVKSGKLKALAVGAPDRLDTLPDVPTLAELGQGAANLSSLFGVFAPAGMPAAVVARLNAEINKVLALPEVRSKLDASDNVPLGGTAADFGKRIAAESESNLRIIRAAGIKGQ